MKQFSMIKPGGVGGLNRPANYYTQRDTTVRPKQELSSDLDEMVIDEYEGSPFVNRSPAEKKLVIGGDGYYK